ncbi:MAG TPA: hypothetical protein VGL93_00840 [Streptosporangiaceae bacterium]|jgi:hypothetical protein
MQGRLREKCAEATGDRGSFYEWLALGVLAALIVVGLAPLVGTSIGDGVSRVICEIVHGGDTSQCAAPGGKPPGKIDINPQWCLSSMHVDDEGVGWKGTIKKIINISIGRGYKMIRYDSREEDFDGKVKHYVYLAFVDKGDASVDIGKAIKGQKIDIGGGAEVQYGAMYRLTPDQADKLQQDISDYQYAKLESEVDGVPGAMAVQSIGRDWPPKIVSDPAITYGETSASGRGSFKPNWSTGKLPTPEKYIVPNGGEVSTQQNKTLTTEHWNIYKDDKGNILPATAVYHMTSGTYTVGVKRAGEGSNSGRTGKAEGTAKRTFDFSNTTRVTTDDKTGDLKNIRYVVTYGDEGSMGADFGLTGKKSGSNDGPSIGAGTQHGQGKLHTEVVQLNFTTPQERAIGKQWLQTHGLEMPPSVANQIFSKTGRMPGIPDDKQVAEPPGPNADPFDQLVYSKAMGWKTDADTTSQAYKLNLQLPFRIGEIGPYADFSSKDSKTMKAQILDAPGADGSRHWIDYPDCTAAGNH